MPHSWPPPALLCALAALSIALPLAAQTAAGPPYLAQTSAAALQTAGVQVSGDVRVGNGQMQLGNGSSITAGDTAVPISLTRGGELKLCATTSIHLARDRSVATPDDTGLLLGLDRGAIEAHYPTGKYSDLLLTPDLRILISGPGQADVSIRVSRQGDTCIDNRGPGAPYITVTSQLEGGLYRVQPGQHVSFQHGSLREVNDAEHEPCGCPPPVSVADAGTSGPQGAAPGHPVSGAPAPPANATAAANPFPLAVSEGLAPAPLPPSTPVAAPGEVHAQVSVPLRYNGSLPTVVDAQGSDATASGAAADAVAPEAATAASPAPVIPRPSPAAPAPVPANMPAAAPAPQPQQPAATANTTAVAQAPPPVTPHPPGFIRRVGRFFARVFGAGQ